MKPSISVTNRKQTASFRIVSSMPAIALLCLATASASAQAQMSSNDANLSTNTAATTSPGDWTQFLGDSMQRSNPYETALGVNNVGSLQLKWTQKNTVPYGGFGNPVVANGFAYFGGGETDPHLYAFNASTGQSAWTFTTPNGDGVLATPAVANGVVYFATFIGGVVYALNATTGAELWSSRGITSPTTDITVADGVVYIGGGNGPAGAIDALDAATGAVLWSYAGSVSSTPAVANGIVYFDVLGGFTGKLQDPTTNDVLALNAKTGKVLWDYFIQGSGPTSSTVVANGVVYFSVAEITSNTSNVYAVSASTGKTLWVYKIPNNAVASSTPAVANGVLYIGSCCFGGNSVNALNASTGKQLWSNQVTETEGLLAPAVANGVVYISGIVTYPSTSGHIYALNASTGATLWTYSLPDSFPNPPIVSHGTVYVTDSHVDKPGQNINYFRAFSVGADLFLRVTPSATTVHQGDLLTFAFPVWNLGPDNAVHEVLNTEVPAGTTMDYIRISGTPGLGTCTQPPYGKTGPIVCHENSSMKPNSTWTVRVTVRVTAPPGTVITANAATMADTPDPNLANNTASASVTVH